MCARGGAEVGKNYLCKYALSTVLMSNPNRKYVHCKKVYLAYTPSFFPSRPGTSNGKSSIVEERLYSFFFAFFQKKNEASFFRFSSFAQLGTKTFVLLRSW